MLAFAIVVVLLLVVLNGLFAMSEMSLAASRKARLQVLVETGDAGAKVAMELHDNPTSFLSTVQIGITSIGILNGIVGEAAFSQPLAAWLKEGFDIAPRAADIGSLALVVVIVAEMFIGATDGMGHRIIDAQISYSLTDMYGSILVAGAMGYGLNLALLFLERSVIHWSGK